MGRLCGCIGGNQPSIKHTKNGVSKLQPDLPMPCEEELNAKFAELVDELDLDRTHREAMFSMTPDKKWQLYCSKKREQDDPNTTNYPDYYIDNLSKMSRVVALTYDKGDQNSRQSMVDSLKTALRTQPQSFVTRFIEKDGLKCLLDFLQAMDNDTLQSSIHTSVIGCIKALMNNSQGRAHVLAHLTAVNIIAQSLSSDNIKTKVATMEILGAMCLVPGGHKKVLSAMVHYQKFASERVRFQTILNDLDRSTGVYRDEVNLKTAIMSFINAVLKYGSGADSLEFRMHIRYEFLMLGLQPVIEKLKGHSNSTLNRHIEFFELVRNSDEKEFAKQFDAVHVDTRSGTSMFELLRKRLCLSTSYSHLLSILQHLIMLPTQNKGVMYWSLLDRLIQQVCMQQKDGSNPDAEVAEIDVNKVVRQLAQENEMKSVQSKIRETQKENDELMRQLAKKERECEAKVQEKDELMQTVNDMKARLEQQTGEVTTLTVRITELQAHLAAEKTEREKLQHFVKSGSLPDDAKMGAFTSTLPPMPPPSVPAPPPPPPPPGGPPPPPPPPGVPGAPGAPPMMMQAAPKKKKVPKSAIALKSFNWTKIPTEKTSSTVWENSQDEKLYDDLDLKDFEKMFSAYQHKEGGAVDNKVKDKPKELSLIDGRRAQNCTILLSRLKMSNEELVKAVLTMDSREELPKDMCEQLLKFVPTPEEAQMLGEHEHEIDQMARADRFLFELTKVQHFEQRLKALYYKKKFSDRMSDAKPKVMDILEASKQLLSSKKVRKLLEIVLAYGNYMNKGNRGNAFGFKITSLNNIGDTKSSVDRSITFLHYLIELFDKQFPDMAKLENEIGKCRDAAKVSLSDLEVEVRKLGKELKDIEKEILYQKNHKTHDPNDKFIHVMSDFITVAGYKFSELEEKFKDMMERYKKLAHLFGEDSKTMAPDEFFGVFDQFLSNLNEAGGQNRRRRKQKEEEEKRQKIDAQMKAERERRAVERKTSRRDGTKGSTVDAVDNEPEGKGEFDDLISALKTGDVYGDDIMKMNKKGGRKRAGKTTHTQQQDSPISVTDNNKNCNTSPQPTAGYRSKVLMKREKSLVLTSPQRHVTSSRQAVFEIIPTAVIRKPSETTTTDRYRQPSTEDPSMTEGIKVGMNVKQMQSSFLDSDDEYDTDLEDALTLNIQRQQSARQKQQDLYMHMCKSERVTPNSRCQKSLGKRHCSLKYLGLNDRDCKALSVPLQMNKSVNVLDLQSNRIADHGVLHIGLMVKENFTLKELNLAENKIAMTGKSLESLCEALAKNKCITKLNLSGNKITDQSAIYIARLIKVTRTLTELDLSHNELCTEGGIQMGSALATNDTLKSLDMSWNHLRLAGAESVAEGLKENVSLKRLLLPMNGFGANGAVAMATSLKMNETLEELDLTNNRVTMDGAAEFGKRLRGNVTLRILKMGKNPVRTQGSLALVKFIEGSGSTGLQLLDMTDVMVLEAFMDSADRIQEKNPDFTVKVGTIVNTAFNKIIKPTDKGISDVNPLEVVITYMESQRMRIIDLFKTWDKDNSQSLSRREFKEGLKSVETPLSESQLDELIVMLDKDGNGEIDLSELIQAIDKDHKDLRRKAVQAYKLSNSTAFPGTASSKIEQSPNILDEIVAMIELVPTPTRPTLLTPDLYSTPGTPTKARNNFTASDLDF